MKALKFFLLALALGVFVACDDTAKTDGGGGDTKETKDTNDTKAPAAETFNIATDGATAMWMGSKAEGAHFGKVGLKGGSVTLADGNLTGGSVSIDLSAITVEDAELPDDLKGKLIGHLSSEDFFNVAQFPEVKLTITGSSKYAGGGETAPEGLPEALTGMFVAAPTHTVNGKLMVKGQENDISFPAMVAAGEGGIDASAFITFDRRAHGLRFMSDTESTVNPDIHFAVSFSASK
ncbi:MAG: YceI family protein [Bacteroidota bacterium]